MIAMGKDGTTVGTQRRIGCPSGLGIYPNDVTSFLTHPHDEWVAGISNHGRSVFGLKLIDSPDRGGFKAIIGERFVDTRRTVVGMHSRMCFLSGFFDDGV